MTMSSSSDTKIASSSTSNSRSASDIRLKEAAFPSGQFCTTSTRTRGALDSIAVAAIIPFTPLLAKPFGSSTTRVLACCLSGSVESAAASARTAWKAGGSKSSSLDAIPLVIARSRVRGASRSPITRSLGRGSPSLVAKLRVPPSRSARRKCPRPVSFENIRSQSSGGTSGNGVSSTRSTNAHAKGRRDTFVPPSSVWKIQASNV